MAATAATAAVASRRRARAAMLAIACSLQPAKVAIRLACRRYVPSLYIISRGSWGNRGRASRHSPLLTFPFTVFGGCRLRESQGRSSKSQEIVCTPKTLKPISQRRLCMYVNVITKYYSSLNCTGSSPITGTNHEA